MHVTNHNATITDHILTNSLNSKIDTRTLKIDVSDHFPTFFTSKSINVKASQDPVFSYKTRYKPFYTFPLQREITQS